MPRDRLVYSTGTGRVRPGKPAAASVPADGIALVRLEKKGRRGKAVTTIAGVSLTGAHLRRLAADLKARCGAGGAVKDGVIEIQGDHRDRVVAELEARNISAKRAGS